MLVFVIPVKSAEVAKSWSQTCKLLERTLRSVCNQTDHQFRVIVVCHEKPQINFFHSSISYVEVDFPPPKNQGRSKVMDRIRKELTGFIAAKKFSPCHIMKIDADDCTSKHLAEFVSKNPQTNGWFVDKGYVYIEGSRSIYLKKKEFYKWNGSSNIIRDNLYDVIQHNLEKLPETDEECLEYYMTHFEVAKTMSERGTPLEALPFFGCVYILGHGENRNPVNNNPYGNEGLISYERPFLTRLKKILFEYRPLTKNICDEFGIYNLDGNYLVSNFLLFDIVVGTSEIIIRGIEPTFQKFLAKIKNYT